MKTYDLFKRVIVTTVILFTAGIVELYAGQPKIEITYIPPIGELGNVEGQVVWDEWNPAEAGQYAIISILKVPNVGDYAKPTWDNYLGAIDASGKFVINVVSHSNDSEHPLFYFYFVRKSTFNGVAGGTVNTGYMAGRYLGDELIVNRTEFWKNIPMSPESNIRPGFVAAGSRITLSCGSGGTIRYTLDGSEPSSSSKVYTNETFTVSDNGMLLIKAISEKDGKKSFVSSMLWIPTESYSTPLFGLNVSLALNDEPFGYQLSKEETEKRMKPIAPLAKWIRTFGTDNANGLIYINGIAKSMGLRTLIGLDVSDNAAKNKTQFDGLRRILKEDKAHAPDLLAVGNEVARKVNASIISDCIDSVRKILSEFNLLIPVGSVDIGGVSWDHSILNKLDFAGVNLYPGTWDNESEAKMFDVLKQSYAAELAKFKSKCVLLTETGTPYSGATYSPPGCGSCTQTPSKTKAAKYLKNVIEWSAQSSIPVFYFEAYDERAKREQHHIEEYFGLMDKNMKIHPFYKDVLGISDDATLKSLVVGAGVLSPAFEPQTDSYTVAVPNDVTSINVTGTANNVKATVKGNAVNKTLEVGENKVVITVTAQDHITVKTYTVTIVRAASSDATLKSLSVSSGAIIPDFEAGIISYTVNVPNNVAAVDITATANHPDATVNGSVKNKPLEVGDNKIDITVTAQDGAVKTYTVTIRRLSNDATLKDLTVSAGVLKFDATITAYTVYVAHNVATIEIKGTPNYSATKIEVTGLDKDLVEGENKITVKATSEDGSATMTYTVTVIRVAESEANPVIAVNGKPIEANSQVEYLLTCDENVLSIKAPYSTITVNDIEYTTVEQQNIALSGDDKLNIRAVSKIDGTENSYTLTVYAPIKEDKLCFQRWDDVVAVNRNPEYNGNHKNITGVRWYERGEFMHNGDFAYISSGSVSDYYAEICINDKWRRVCSVPIKRSPNAIVAYPNPVPRGERLKLELPESLVNGRINMYDITGALKKTGTSLTAAGAEIDVSDLNSGIYLLQIVNDKSHGEVKIVIE
jgi:hypothetical protein